MSSAVAAWPLVALGEAVQQVSRAESVQADKEYRLLGIRLDGNGPFLRETKLGAQTAAGTLFRVSAGDFIYSRLFAWRGAFGTIDDTLDGCYVSGEFPTFRSVLGRIDFEFLRYWFRLPSTLAIVEADCSGSTPLTRNRFKERFFLRLEIPLPPLEEQRRIVGRIEALAGRIAQARGLRRETMEEAEALWRSSLANAFQGRHSPCIVETGEELLQRQALKYARTERSNYNGARPGQPSVYQQGLFSIPGEWAWTDIGSVLTHLIDCVNDTPNFSPISTDYLGLKSTNIKPYVLDLRERWYVTEEDYKHWTRRETPKPGDLILTREAPMGNACLIPDGVCACLTQRIMLLRTDGDFVDEHYLLHYLNSSYFQQQVLEQCRGLTTPHIRVGDAPALMVPLPPRNAQADIVAYLDGVQARVEALKRLQAETAAELEALLPAVLERALRGEL